MFIQIKATEQYKAVLSLEFQEFVDEILKRDHSNESYKVVLTFESVDEILKCDHSNESY